jgi:hypothetical protein
VYLLTFVVSLCVRTNLSGSIHPSSGNPAELTYIQPVIQNPSDTDITRGDKDLPDMSLEAVEAGLVKQQPSTFQT